MARRRRVMKVAKAVAVVESAATAPSSAERRLPVAEARVVAIVAAAVVGAFCSRYARGAVVRRAAAQVVRHPPEAEGATNVQFVTHCILVIVQCHNTVTAITPASQQCYHR